MTFFLHLLLCFFNTFFILIKEPFGFFTISILVLAALFSSCKVDKKASRRVEVKFRLKDDEMIEELSKIMAGSEESAADTATEAGADAAAN